MLMIAVMATVIIGFSTVVATAATCTPTGFSRDGINMTAALINPSGTVTGVVDATGCNIGVYYDAGHSGVIKNAEIFGANYFGVLANGDNGDVSLDVLDSTIRKIGESPLNGSQHGVAIYWRAFGSMGSVTGKISGNTIFGYQKGGIVTNGQGAQAIISENNVTGVGATPLIAQNGIQVGYGASASVMRNKVSNNSYSGTSAASGGILVVGGSGYGADSYTVNTKINDNVLTNNDVGVYLSNLDTDYLAPSTATNIKVVNNTISNETCTNNYQAGVSDVGNNDKIINNSVSGNGYLAPCGVTIDADVSFTNRPKVHANK